MMEEQEVVTSVQPKTHGPAIAALVCGVLAWLLPILGLILALFGIVLGVKAKSAIDASRGALTGRHLALIGMISGIGSVIYQLFIVLPVLLAISIPNFISMQTKAKEIMIKANMHNIRMTVEQFPLMTDGYYPATINTTVGDILDQLGSHGDDELSLADAGTNDPATGAQLNATENALLEENYVNPFKNGPHGLVLGTWIDGEPTWSSETSGMVWYVPLGINGNYAAGYKIYGVGAKEILTYVLSSED